MIRVCNSNCKLFIYGAYTAIVATHKIIKEAERIL